MIQQKFIFYTLIFTVCILSFSCKSKSKISVQNDKLEESLEKMAVNFVNASLLADVLKIAKDQNKLVYLDIGAKWCAPCKLLKKNVYTDIETADLLNEYFIPYLVDGEKNEGPDLALIYGVEAYPTLLILDDKGKVIVKRVGGIGIKGLQDFLNEGLALKTNQ